jgi:hypothetical protein
VEGREHSKEEAEVRTEQSSRGKFENSERSTSKAQDEVEAKES